MATYIDGFVLPLPTDKVAEYQQMAKKAAKVWIEHGALEYRECLCEDDDAKGGIPFSKLSKAKAGEIAVFAWVVYKSKAHRDRVLAKVMKDPRLACDMKTMPFDPKRMAYGGFKTIVSADSN